jgi:Ca-activated chloride channel homolog
MSGARGWFAILLCTMLGAAACTSTTAAQPSTITLRALATPELTDMEPLLADLRRDTGVELVLDYQGAVEASNALTPGDYRHDLAWLASDQYFRLKVDATRFSGPKPLSTNIMSSPLVIGVKRSVAQRLRGDQKLTWADVADSAAAGTIRFGMPDPHKASSGLAALVGVATAATGTGKALLPEDVACDRLRGFFAGQTMTADTSNRLRDEYIGRQDAADALINYESVLLSLNASGKLADPLEIVYPDDGVVRSDYPLLLLDQEKRAAYDKVVGWLTSEATQKKIMVQTLRRPLHGTVSLDPRLAPVGTSLQFPENPDVLAKLLANYGPEAVKPGHVIFLLDFSGSMRGDRLATLRSTFTALSGGDSSATGKFSRFYKGETFTIVRFGGRILGEQTFTVGAPGQLEALNAFLGAEDLDQTTGVWSALQRGYQLANDAVTANPKGPVSIVLMTDGVSNTGPSLDEFLNGFAALPEASRKVHTYTIRFGEANAAELDRAARTTGGRLIDANATSLLDAFKETRGCT